MKVTYISRSYSNNRGMPKSQYISRPYARENKEYLSPSFTGKRINDRYIAEKFYRDFLKLIDSDIDVNKQNLVKNYGFDAKSFFNDLNNQNDTVISHFLLSRNGTPEAPFSMALVEGKLHIAKSLLDIAEDTDDITKFKFLVPDKNRMNGPLIMSVNYDKTLLTTHKIFSLVKTLKPEQQAEFYYMQPKNTFGINTDIVEELRESGYPQVAQEFEAERAQFELDNPIIAGKYQNALKNTNKKNDKARLSDEETKEKTKSNFKVYSHVKTRFSDVGGMFNVKKQIQEELLNILNNPKVKNADKPGGIILFGPPGTGKTLLATAIAGEAGVPLISTNGSSFNEIYVGAGAKNVRELYAQARKLARASETKTAIVFIDEADAVAGKRGASSNREGDATLNALLGELDGVQSKEENDIKVITIFATNRRDLFDNAFRKGRIDMEFKIDDPRFSEKARREILAINAKDKPFKNDTEKNKLLDELAKSSAGMSGAELADVIKRSYRKTLYKDRQLPYITAKDIQEAKLEAIVGIKNDSEKSDYELQKTRAHEAGHAINQIVLNNVFKDEAQKSKQPMQALDFIVNESRGDAAGLTMMKPTDNNRITVESLLSRLAVNYGGYSVEECLFDCHTDGVSSDLKNCTDLILQATTEWGLGSKTKYIGCDTNGVTFELFKPDIKNDIIRYSNTGMEIANMITEFTEPFIKEYIDKITTGPLANADIITGEKFEKMFDNWVKQNNKQKEFEKLSHNIKQEMKIFKEDMKQASMPDYTRGSLA